MGFNLTTRYLPGAKNQIADYLSRHPNKDSLAPDYPRLISPALLPKHRTVNLIQGGQLNDVTLKDLIEAGKSDQEYIDLLQLIQQGKHPKQLPGDHKLKVYNNIYDKLSIFNTEVGNIVLYDDDKLLIPRNRRSTYLKLLHQYHHSDAQMIRLAGTRWVWPGLSGEIKDLWNNCSICQEQRVSKQQEHRITDQVISNLKPLEVLNMDWATCSGKNYVIAADRATGYLFAKQCPSQSTSESLIFLREIFDTYGLSVTVRSDNGPSFRGHFTNQLEEMGVAHHTSSPYNASSNGLAEVSVRTIKRFLLKNGPLRGQDLQRLILYINCTENNVAGQGSPYLRFHSRNPRLILPQFTSLEPVDSHALILKRGQVHQQTALRNTRGNRESFSIGDRVSVCDKDHARWERLG